MGAPPLTPLRSFSCPRPPPRIKAHPNSALSALSSITAHHRVVCQFRHSDMKPFSLKKSGSPHQMPLPGIRPIVPWMSSILSGESCPPDNECVEVKFNQNERLKCSPSSPSSSSSSPLFSWPFGRVSCGCLPSCVCVHAWACLLRLVAFAAPQSVISHNAIECVNIRSRLSPLDSLDDDASVGFSLIVV